MEAGEQFKIILYYIQFKAGLGYIRACFKRLKASIMGARENTLNISMKLLLWVSKLSNTEKPERHILATPVLRRRQISGVQ